MTRPASGRDTASMASRSSRTFAVLLVLAVLDSTGYSIIGPVLPALASATGASATTLGLLTAPFPLTLLPGFVLGVRLLRRSRHGVLVGGLVLPAGGSRAFVRSDKLALPVA